MDNMIVITKCGDCPFHYVDSNYGDFCNHPCNKEGNCGTDINDIVNIHQKRVGKERSYFNFDNVPEYLKPIIKARCSMYVETTPIECPLRDLKSINIGIVIPVELDETMFTENVNKWVSRFIEKDYIPKPNEYRI